MGATLIIRETDSKKYCVVNVTKSTDIEGYLVLTPLNTLLIDSIANCGFPEFWDGDNDDEFFYNTLEEDDPLNTPNEPNWEDPPPLFWFYCGHTTRNHLYGRAACLMDFLRYGEQIDKWRIDIERIW